MTRSTKRPLLYLALGSAWAIAMCAWVIFPRVLSAIETGTSCTAQTQATVIAFDDQGITSHTDILHYTVAGVTYVTRVPGAPADLGTTIPVHYNPQNPGQAYLGEEKHFSWTPYVVFVAVFILGTFLFLKFAYLDAINRTKRRA